jgi:GT2 family glycosyltransferase
LSGPRTALVILTKDGGDHLPDALSALGSAREPRGGLEIVLVDNGSTRDPSVHLGKLRNARIVRSERNVGFARGVRLGAAATSADVLLLVNDDAFVEKESLAILVEALEAAPRHTIAAAGMLTDASGTRIDFVDGAVTFDGHALQRGFGAPISETERVSSSRERLFPCGGFCALKRREFEELGGFDDDFFAYLEDVDFGFRATLSGRTAVFVPEARARHLSGATGRRLGLTMRGVLFEANAFAVAYKNFGERTLRALLPAILATFQHRAVAGVLSHQAGAPESLSDPFSPRALPVPPAQPLPAPPSRRQRAVRTVSRLVGVNEPKPAPHPGPGEPLLLDDPYARMWLVAARRIVSSWSSLAEKRARVQALRTVDEEEILRRYPLHLVPTYPGDAELFASSFFRALLPDSPRLVETTLEAVASVP